MINIHFSLQDNVTIKVDCNNRELVDAIYDLLCDYKKGYRFMPKYKAGKWDGKISLFKKMTRTFPYGLFPKVAKYIKKEWVDKVNMTISNEIYWMFGSGNKPEYTYDLAYKPYPYQQEVIESMVKTTKGVAVVATAGGKSLIITYMIRNIPEKYSKSLIIVPTLQLVDQFKGDMIEYGIPEDMIGQVNADNKEFDKAIVISTWQSLSNQMDKLDLFRTVIVDEVHTAQAATISTILESCPNAVYRFGVTGTLPTNKLDEMSVLSYLGPVLKTFTGRDLADLGYVSKCTIKQLWIKYGQNYGKDYQYIRDNVFLNPKRMSVIRGIAKRSNNSVLILVDRIEKEGVILEKYLKEQLPKKEVVFLSGKDKSDVRDKWRKDMNDRKNIVCIATYPIFQQGVNIPSLREIILASSTKSFVRVIQSLGRTLRKHVSKELGGAILWDICDDVKHLRGHAQRRYRHYIKEKHDVEETVVNQ